MATTGALDQATYGPFPQIGTTAAAGVVALAGKMFFALNYEGEWADMDDREFRRHLYDLDHETWAYPEPNEPQSAPLAAS